MNNMNVDDIVKVLNEKGKVVAIKTDTVYGLICNALDVVAVSNIYKICTLGYSQTLNIEKAKSPYLYLSRI